MTQSLTTEGSAGVNQLGPSGVRSVLAIPCAIGALMFAWLIVFFHASLYNHVPPRNYHSFVLLCYYGIGLLVSPNKRPVFAALLAIISVLPWMPSNRDETGLTDYGRNSDDELLFFFVGFGVTVTLLATIGSLIADGLQRLWSWQRRKSMRQS